MNEKKNRVPVYMIWESPPPISERPYPIDFNGVKRNLGKTIDQGGR